MPFRLSTPSQAGLPTHPLAHRHDTSQNVTGHPCPVGAEAGSFAQQHGAATGSVPGGVGAQGYATRPDTAVERHRASSFDRRTALRAAGAGALGALTVAAVAACAEEPVHDPDPLATHELQARADAAAASAAIALAPHLQSLLSTIAAQRTEHAEALAAEIARLVGVYGDGTTPVHKTRPPSAPPAAIAAPGIEQLRDQLSRSRRATAELAVTLSGYRAGLLASISAACAVHAEGLITA
ncbi:hypothetical protein [Nocardia shimofusensis]|uniref:hypothetical protein n=1 Tax=Nocardia shimofusensis TaxID=228596 RepID=UPI000A4E89CC|nr:hypothetical protein [Nocardia shimofusensis]